MDTSFDRQGGSEEWYTPPEIVKALGSFDLDPCAANIRPEMSDVIFGPHNYASKTFTNTCDGLSQPWNGRVWMNPPYGREMGAWMKKLALHGDGIALVFARTETQAFFDHVWGRASGMLFLRGRIKFWYYGPDGFQAMKSNAGAPSVLISYDKEDSWANAEALKNSRIPGHFVDLTPSEIIWSGWRAALISVLQFGPLPLHQIYDCIEKSIHRPSNHNIRAKIRQTLYRNDDVFERTSPDSDYGWQLRGE